MKTNVARKLALTLGAACLAAPLVSALPAQAAPSSTTTFSTDKTASVTAVTGKDATTLASLHSWLTSNGASDKTADSLITKYKANKGWDSYSNKVAPVDTTTKNVNGDKVTREVYPDGSIAVTTIGGAGDLTPKAGPAAGTMRAAGTPTVGSCDSYINGHYQISAHGCLVNRSTSVLGARFRADYTINVGQWNDAIGKVYTPIATSGGVGYTDLQLTLVRGAETQYQKAQAHMQYKIDGPVSGFAGSVVLMDFYVGNGAATASANF